MPAHFENHLLAAVGIEEFLVAQGKADGALGIAAEGRAVAADRLLGEEDADAAQRPAAIGAAGGGGETVDAPVGVQVNQSFDLRQRVGHFAEEQHAVADGGGAVAEDGEGLVGPPESLPSALEPRTRNVVFSLPNRAAALMAAVYAIGVWPWPST